MIASPVTLTATGGSGFLAGPPATEPSEILNLLPWQGQLMVPSETVLTVQPWWVQVVEKATMLPASGWVTTTLAGAKIRPPPTGMSATVASASGDAASGDPDPGGESLAAFGSGTSADGSP